MSLLSLSLSLSLNFFAKRTKKGRKREEKEREGDCFSSRAIITQPSACRLILLLLVLLEMTGKRETKKIASATATVEVVQS